MCGIAGILTGAGARRPRGRAAAHGRGDRPPRTRRPAARTSTGRSASRTAGWPSSTSRPPATSRCTEDGRYTIVYNGEIYNFRDLRDELRARGHALPLAHRHRGRAARLSRVGAGVRRALQRDVRASRSGTASERELFLARDRYGIKPLYWTPRRRRAAVRFGDQVLPAAPGLPRARLRPSTCSSTSRSRTSSPTARCSTACACSRPARTRSCARATRDPPHAVLGLGLREPEPATALPTPSTARSSTGCSARPCSASSSPTCRSARTCRGGMDSGSHHGAGGARAAVPGDVHRRLRHDLVGRPGDGRRRAREGRGDELPLQDRALRVGAEGRRHGALPARRSSGTWRTCASARATRTGTSRGWRRSS